MKLTLISPRAMVRRMIDTDEWARMLCPFEYKGHQCESTPHLLGLSFGLDTPKESSSGPGLILDLECEHGHRWQMLLVDHSGSLWIEFRELASRT